MLSASFPNCETHEQSTSALHVFTKLLRVEKILVFRKFYTSVAKYVNIPKAVSLSRPQNPFIHDLGSSWAFTFFKSLEESFSRIYYSLISQSVGCRHGILAFSAYLSCAVSMTRLSSHFGHHRARMSSSRYSRGVDHVAASTINRL